MTTQQVIALAKEKLGKDLTEQEAQDYLSCQTAIPDEALSLVSGGAHCGRDFVCPNCGSSGQENIWYNTGLSKTTYYCTCQRCGNKFTIVRTSSQ